MRKSETGTDGEPRRKLLCPERMNLRGLWLSALTLQSSAHWSYVQKAERTDNKSDLDKGSDARIVTEAKQKGISSLQTQPSLIPVP